MICGKNYRLPDRNVIQVGEVYFFEKYFKSESDYGPKNVIQHKFNFSFEDEYKKRKGRGIRKWSLQKGKKNLPPK
jgi:hypothetical protein